MKRVKMLIGVFSCRPYMNRREGCLQTWADVGGREDVDLLFVLGGGPAPWPVREGCLLHCPCPDDYDSLSLKTRWLCLWGLVNYHFDFLFKCDDDTYVHIERLLDCGVPGDYVGGSIRGHPSPHASGGAGYRLTPRAAMTVATSTMRLASYEDLLVWQVLTNAGIPLRSDPRFGFNSLQWPRPDNDQITCHWCSDHRMREIHGGLYPSTSARTSQDSP